MANSKSISAKAKAKLAEWHQKKPTFALMGEYSAGKSTLLNLLIGEDVAPTQVTATNLPPLWVTFSDEPFCEGLRHNGNEDPLDLSQETGNLRDSFVLLRIGLPADRLKTHDIIDTPGISDPTLPKGALRFLTEYLDFVVWCSAANQAWRQTERAAWLKFPEALRANSLLVLTRADKLRNETDLNKVLRRVKRDTDGLFQDVLPIKTTKAMQVSPELRTSDLAGAWATTGGYALCAALEQCLEKPSQAEEAEPAAAKAPEPDQAIQTPTEIVPADGSQTAFQALESKVTKISQSDRLAEHLAGIKDLVDEVDVNSASHQAVIAACLDIRHEEDLDLDRTMLQIKADLASFRESDWARLDD